MKQGLKKKIDEDMAFFDSLRMWQDSLNEDSKTIKEQLKKNVAYFDTEDKDKSDTPVLDTALKWIGKINKKYGQGMEGFEKWNKEEEKEEDKFQDSLHEDKHTIYPVGPYMKGLK